MTDADLTKRLRALAAAPKTSIVKLTRVRQFSGADPGRTLYFTFEGGQRSSSRSRSSFVKPDHVPPFDGDEGWFEIEQVRAKPWSFWRALRQVSPPG